MSEQEGKIIWFNGAYGYIRALPQNIDTFYHIDDCDFEPRESIKVRFEIGYDKHNRKKAINVKRIKKESVSDGKITD